MSASAELRLIHKYFGAARCAVRQAMAGGHSGSAAMRTQASVNQTMEASNTASKLFGHEIPKVGNMEGLEPLYGNCGRGKIFA